MAAFYENKKAVVTMAMDTKTYIIIVHGYNFEVVPTLPYHIY